MLTLICIFAILLTCLSSHGFSENEDPVVAIVNNVPIKKSQFDRSIENYKASTHKQELTNDEQMKLIESLIDRQLLLTHEAVDKYRQDEMVERQVKEYEDQLVIQRFLDAQVRRHLTVNEDEIKDFYKKNMYKFHSPPKVKCSHILLRDNKTALEVEAKLKQGKDFTELAKKYSIDLPGALEGGTMGILEKGKCLPEIEAVAFILDEGEISEIVGTRYGYHIVRVDEFMGTKYKPFDKVRENIKRTILIQKESNAFKEMAAELKKDASIKNFGDQILSNP